MLNPHYYKKYLLIKITNKLYINYCKYQYNFYNMDIVYKLSVTYYKLLTFSTKFNYLKKLNFNTKFHIFIIFHFG